ncbi:hypothetical protein TESS_TESS_01078 [Tessaracoccus sp. O5.2]
MPFTHGLVSRVPWRTLEVTSDERGARVRLAVESPAFAHLPGAGHYAAAPPTWLTDGSHTLGLTVAVAPGPAAGR